MKSFIIFMQRWGLILLGIILMIGSLVYGAIPQKTPYQSITKTFIAHYLSGQGTGYMQLENSPTLFIINEGRFLPDFNAAYLNHGNILLSFLYRSNETNEIDVSSDSNVHLKGTAYTVERIFLYHQFGRPPEVFRNSEYSQNPNGYYQHNWMTSIAITLLGLIFIGSGYFMTAIRSKKTKQRDFITTSATFIRDDEKLTDQVDQIKEAETVKGNVDESNPFCVFPFRVIPYFHTLYCQFATIVFLWSL